MATQIQTRGAASGTQNIRTLTSREIDIDTTATRLCIHDGSTAGGIQHINFKDQQNSTFNYVAVSGTNALTGSLAEAPASYQAGQSFFIKTANSNTGSVTLNINSLGAKTLKKIFNGALSDLGSGDIISGQMLNVLYDGTYFQVLSGSGSEFAEQSWIPTGDISSYTASECAYVEYGDSVTVCFEVEMESEVLDFTKTITNFPFSPKTRLSFVMSFTGASYSKGDFIAGSSNNHVDVNRYFMGTLDGTTLTLNERLNSGGSSLYVRGHITYIKA